MISTTGFTKRNKTLSLIGRIGASLLLAYAALSLSPSGAVQAETLKIGGTGAALGSMRMLGDAFMRAHPEVTVEIPTSLGSGGGIKAVLAGALDISLSSRPLKDKERKAGAEDAAYAVTPFLLVTSWTDRETRLSSKEVVDIFDGTRATWQNGAPIRLVVRPASDSDSKILVEFIPGIGPALEDAQKRRGVSVAYTDQDAMDSAESLAGSLTTASLTSIIAENRTLRPVIVDGVAPTIENVENGTYRMSKTLYVVTGSTVTGLARAFLRFLRSAEAVKILRNSGNLVVTPEGTQFSDSKNDIAG